MNRDGSRVKIRGRGKRSRVDLKNLGLPMTRRFQGQGRSSITVQSLIQRVVAESSGWWQPRT